MTGKQRAKIYRRGAEKIFKKPSMFLFESCGHGWFDLPETDLFLTRLCTWQFNNLPNKYRANVRITALLLCEQMALDN